MRDWYYNVFFRTYICLGSQYLVLVYCTEFFEALQNQDCDHDLHSLKIPKGKKARLDAMDTWCNQEPKNWGGVQSGLAI